REIRNAYMDRERQAYAIMTANTIVIADETAASHIVLPIMSKKRSDHTDEIVRIDQPMSCKIGIVKASINSSTQDAVASTARLPVNRMGLRGRVLLVVEWYALPLRSTRSSSRTPITMIINHAASLIAESMSYMPNHVWKIAVVTVWI